MHDNTTLQLFKEASLEVTADAIALTQDTLDKIASLELENANLKIQLGASNVELHKVASAPVTPELSNAQIDSVTKTLTREGFLTLDKQASFKRSLCNGGIDAIVHTLEKVANVAIIPASPMADGMAVPKASPSPSGNQLSVEDQQWATALRN